MRLLVILWLFILSDGIGALIGARAAWRMRTPEQRKSELAIALSVGLTLYAIAQFAATYNSIINGQGVVYSPHFLRVAVTFRLFQTLGIWIIALTLMNGRQGFIRRALTKILVGRTRT